MPPVRYRLPPLEDDADFDRLCRDLFRHHWSAEGDQLNGRSGQPQHGVDFYGYDPRHRLRGGQSKSRNNPAAPLTEAEVREEARKALAFTPPLHEYVIATSGPRDARLQRAAREITAAHGKRRPRRFGVTMYFWDDLLELLHRYPEVRAAYYGPFDGGAVAAPVEQPRQGTRDAAPRPEAPRFAPPPPFPDPQHAVVGRDREMQCAIAALRERKPVLIHGMGGIGKTALAAAIVARLQAEAAFVDGIIWIEEIGAASLDLLCDAIAREVGNTTIAGLTGRAKAAAVRELLAGQDALLALDDVMAVETGRAFIDTCLPPRRALLLTSRRRSLSADLRASIPLAPLDRAASIALFHARAGMDPARDEPAVAALCALLEDHPLALTVAAGRARVEDLPLASLRERLADAKMRLSALRLDEGGDKNRNVRVSLQLSLDDLTELQRRVFLALASCFGDTTGVEFLADVVGLPQSGCEDVVGQLVARSLLQRRGDRLRLHRLVRDLGREVADATSSAGQAQVVAAARAFAYRYDQPTLERHDKLEAEWDNLRAAARSAADRGDRRGAIALATHLVNPVLGARGFRAELIALGRLGMAAADALGDEAALAGLANNMAGLLQGDVEEARRLYARSMEIRRRLGDRSGIAHCLHNLGVIACETGQTDGGRRLLRRGLAIRRALGDDLGIGASLLALGRLAHEEGAARRARRLYEESRAIFAALGDLRGTANVAHQLGNLAHEQGNYARAWELYRESLALAGELKDQHGIAANLNNLGTILEKGGRLAAARQILVRSLVIKERLRDRHGIASGLHNLANIAAVDGDADEALRLYGQSLRINRQTGDRSGVAGDLQGLGNLARQRGDAAEARHLIAQSLALFEQVGSPHARMVRRQLELLAHDAGDLGPAPAADASDCAARDGRGDRETAAERQP